MHTTHEPGTKTAVIVISTRRVGERPPPPRHRRPRRSEQVILAFGVGIWLVAAILGGIFAAEVTAR
jgi:hypothetical protein